MADSIQGGDLDTMVGVKIVVMAGITLGTMVVREAMVAEVTEVQEKMASKAEVGQMAVEEAVMARLFAIDIANPGM